MTQRKKESKQSKKAVMIGVSIFAVLVFVAIALVIKNSIYSVKIKINVAPSDAEIIIGDKQYHNGTFFVKPGVYSVEVKRDGFNGYNDEIYAEAGRTYYVYRCLAETEESNGFYASRPDEQKICFAAEEYLLAKADEYRKRDPIFQVTPYHNYNNGYKIDSYFKQEADEIVIKITALSCDSDKRSRIYQMALDYLEKNDINTKNYRIEKRNGCQ